MIAISGTVITFLFDDIKNNINDQGLFYLVIAFIYVFILLGFLTYLLLSFRELYFHKQSQDVGTYFNTMCVFFLLASVSALIPKELDIDFIEKTFFVVSVLLMIYNSLKISWIAFISKKEKLTLLVLSILIVLLFILNLSSAGENDVHSRILINFSPSLNNFFEIIMLYGSIYFSILFFTTLFHIPTAEVFDRKANEVKNFISSSNPEDKYSSAVISPIKTHDKLRGYLTAVKKGSAIFNEDDIEAINTFSDYASVAIENSMLLEQSIEKERLEKELDVAREIQRKILPEKNPQLKGISISSVFIPAFEVGGDYYDFFKLDNNKIGFIIADVSGKGISAAFIMAEIKGIFESLCKTLSRPKEILVNANEILLTTLDKKTFVSAAFGVLDLNENTLRLARAGHCPLLMVRDGIATNLKPSGIALGISESDFFSETLEEISLDLKEQDILVLYTDGITEAKNSNLEDFGDSKFENIILENSRSEPDEISSCVIQQVTLFSQSLAQYDDITLVIFKLNKN
ncbi:MAG: SpoIIE family protein phosphatase [Ignavibacteriales bacterium]|nr:SpoIIE family protein phosphatase [Ignavibacteriales bacterium]